MRLPTPDRIEEQRRSELLGEVWSESVNAGASSGTARAPAPATSWRGRTGRRGAGVRPPGYVYPGALARLATPVRCGRDRLLSVLDHSIMTSIMTVIATPPIPHQ